MLTGLHNVGSTIRFPQYHNVSRRIYTLSFGLAGVAPHLICHMHSMGDEHHVGRIRETDSLPLSRSLGAVQGQDTVWRMRAHA